VREFPDLPEGITSFGAAVTDGWLYVYGGHKGDAHSYSIEEQSNAFRRLNLSHPEQWEDLPHGPRLQGLTLVAHSGKLYRVGGFTARNREGEDHSLFSTAELACFDPRTGEWEPKPPLPEPRSSHDAVVIGATLYVAGGWSLRGEQDTIWLQSAYELDLSKQPLVWNELPTPPFQRRALTLGEFEGKLYVIGGMQKKGGPTTRVDVFDPKDRTWSKGPALRGKGMDGFGASAFATGGNLYVSTFNGNLQRLNVSEARWDQVQNLRDARFFHRMLPLSDHQLVLVGGANMGVGKFLEIETVDVE
jgi:N-acetylneuraminic acid mutarotase